jgi:hypothetical protein
VEIWQSTQAKRASAIQSALSSANRIEQPSASIERRPADQSLDLKTNPWLRIGLLTFAWVVAVGLVLVGFGHCISGTPHGFGLICSGVALAVAAVILA